MTSSTRISDSGRLVLGLILVTGPFSSRSNRRSLCACSSFTVREERALRWSEAAYNHPGRYFIEGHDLCYKDFRLETLVLGLILVSRISFQAPLLPPPQNYPLPKGASRRHVIFNVISSPDVKHTYTYGCPQTGWCQSQPPTTMNHSHKEGSWQAAIPSVARVGILDLLPL